MIKYKELLDEGLISPSIGELLFTADEQKQRSMLVPRAFARTAYKVCLFYSSLVQAYMVGRAIEADKNIYELGYPERITTAIKHCWSEHSYSFAGMTMFSFLKDCAMHKLPQIMTEDSAEILRIVCSNYEVYMNPHSRMMNQLPDEAIKRLLRALPLLANTEFSIEDAKFIFRNEDGTPFATKASPFICFWDTVNNMPIESPNTHCFVLTSVRKGDRNGELLFGIANLNDHDVSKEPRIIRRQASQNEHLRMVCRAMELETDWYAVEECWCDLAFLNRLTTVNRVALSAFWAKSANRMHRVPSKIITEKLRDMFFDSELHSKIEADREITEENIDNIFYELYINCGVFKTMSALFLDSRQHEYGEELFDIYMSKFVSLGYITEEERVSYETECEEKIASRLHKLLGFAPENSPRYNRRSRAIKAEWRAFCALKAAGIHADKLFTDEEELHSIDDYYDMIRNKGTALTEDLRNVLLMVTEFYGALLKNQPTFDEAAFHRELWVIRKKNDSKSVRALFADLLEIAERSADSPVVEKLLGRDSVCRRDRLERFINYVCEELDRQHIEIPPQYGEKKIFISYAHADKDKVRPYIERWRSKGIRYIFDEERFKPGINWFEVAKKEIGSEECIAVIVFMSKSAAVSRAVADELTYATRKAAPKKFPHDPERRDGFVYAINLEDDMITNYLADIINEDAGDSQYDPERCNTATRIRDILHEKKLHAEISKDPEARMEKIDLEISAMICPESDGEPVEDTREYNELELAVANFYAFLKFGDDFEYIQSSKEMDEYFKQAAPNISRCIFPLVASVKETKIKRDNIALVGYEIISGKGERARVINHILSCKKLSPDDYYCVPNYRTMASNCSWMVEPLLVGATLFSNAPKEK